MATIPIITQLNGIITVSALAFVKGGGAIGSMGLCGALATILSPRAMGQNSVVAMATMTRSSGSMRVTSTTRPVITIAFVVGPKRRATATRATDIVTT